MLPSITHSHIVLNLYDFMSSAEHKTVILKNVGYTKQHLLPIDFYLYGGKRTFLKILYVIQKNEGHTALESRDGE